MAYVDRVLDHFANPRNLGPIPAADGVGCVGDRACHDVFKVWVRVRGGRVQRAAFQVRGCPAAIATASMMTVLAEGRTLDEALALTDDQIVSALGELPEFKMHCSNSAAEALHAAVEDCLYASADAGGRDLSTLMEKLRLRLRHVCVENGLLDRGIEVSARDLTPEEALGDPDHDDYPAMTGRERIIEARLGTSRGQAFTDRPGNFSGTLSAVLHMPLENNYRRAVLVATANAVAGELGLAGRTVHCRSGDLVACAGKAADFLRKRFPECRRVFLVGLQPQLLDALAAQFEVRVTDLDPDGIGQRRSGVSVEPAAAAPECLEWCDAVLAAGSTVANGTADALVESGKPIAFYGVTCAAAAALLDLERFCPLGR